MKGIVYIIAITILILFSSSPAVFPMPLEDSESLAGIKEFFSSSPEVFPRVLEVSESLAGIKEFNVLSYVPRDLRKYGLTAEQIKVDIELKLRIAGIKISSKLGTAPLLAVEIYTLEDFRLPGILAYVFNVLVYEPLPTLDSGKLVKGIIWMSSNFGLVGSKKMNLLRDGVKDTLDRFVNSYLSANPRRPN